MSFPTSNLSGLNVLRDVHDVANQALRTTATATLVVPPSFDVDITHTEDSVRLGDGTGFITSTVYGSKRAVDVNNLNTPNSFSVNTLLMPSSSTVYTFTIPSGTKKINIKSRLTAKFKINFNNPITVTDYISIPAGSVFFQDNFLTLAPMTLFAQSNVNNDVLEILLLY